MYATVTAAMLWGAGTASADGGTGLLTYSLQPQLFNSSFRTGAQGDELTEARLHSGLAVAVKNPLLNVAVDYRLQSQLKDSGALDESLLSQRLGASLRSTALNRLLGMSAGIEADSLVKSAGDSYRYRVVPAFSKAIADVANLSVRYEYVLDKASPAALPREHRYYSLGLKGALQEGRLTWNGALSEEGVDAGLAWSPRRGYSLAFKLNRRLLPGSDEVDYYGTGRLSWVPRPHLTLSLDYGDSLVEGDRGVMFTTRLDLDRS